MVSGIYKKSFSALKKQPFRLWGIALLGAFLYLAACIGFIAVPAAAFCVNLLLSASLAMIFLNSYRTGLEPKTAYLFAAFRKDRLWRVCSSGSFYGHSSRSPGSCSASSARMNTPLCPTFS